jgi:hypothetical protein
MAQTGNRTRYNGFNVWKTPHSPALVGLSAGRAWERRIMRGLFIGLLVLLLIVGGGFAALLVMADSGAPDPQEIRIEVGDELRGQT